MITLKSAATLAVVLMSPAFCAGQSFAPLDSSEVSAPLRADQRDAGPVLSSNDGWARTMVEVILLGFFVPAAIIGPWVRKRAASQLPELHVQEEQSGLTASQHEPGHLR